MVKQLTSWAKQEKPNEAAGYLFKDNVIFVKIITTDKSGAHFCDQEPEKVAELIGKYGKPTAIFHSHPCEAVPSYTDLRYMSTSIPFWGCVWLIMSDKYEIRAWTIAGNHNKFPQRGETIYPKELEVEIY